MPVLVHGYTKHVNGRLVTVHSYNQSREGNSPVVKGETITRGTVRQIPQARSHLIVAEPGEYQLSSRSAKYSHGLAPHALFPAGRTHPVIIWTRNFTGLPQVFLSAASDWQDSIQEALDHILLVIKNNPGRDMDEILHRYDVQDALRSAGAQGAARIIGELKSIWQDNQGPESSDYLNRVISNIYNNGATFPNRMSSRLLDGESLEARKIILKDRLRAKAAEAVIETRAKTEAALQSFADQGVTHIRWRSHLDDKTCSTCKALHGTTTAINTEFNRNLLRLAKIKPYGTLIGPPRHVGCRCELEPV